MIFEILYRVVQNCTELYRVVQRLFPGTWKFWKFSRKMWAIASRCYPTSCHSPQSYQNTFPKRRVQTGVSVVGKSSILKNSVQIETLYNPVQPCTTLYSPVRNGRPSRKPTEWHVQATLEIANCAGVITMIYNNPIVPSGILNSFLNVS